LLDRYILRQFLRAYVGCFLSFLALYVVMDVFTKLEEFTEPDAARRQASRDVDEIRSASTQTLTYSNASTMRKMQSFFRNMGVYYGYRLPVFFDRMNGMIALMAAVFTLGWLERQNELLGFLASGVSMRRLIVPVAAAVLVLLGLGVANREELIPRCAPVL